MYYIENLFQTLAKSELYHGMVSNKDALELLLAHPGKGRKYFFLRESEDFRIVVTYVDRSLQLCDREFGFDTGELDVSS